MSTEDGNSSEYWYCVKHRAVEGADGCRAKDRLGPYPSRDEAERALDLVAERNEQWDNDPRWNDDAPEDRSPS